MKAISPPSWAAPPPVRRTTAAIVAAPPVAVDDLPGDDFPEDSDTATVPEPTKPSAALPKVDAGVDVSHRRKRNALAFVAAALVVLASLAAYVAYRDLSRRRGIETDIAARADEDYRRGDFAAAARYFQQLQRDYPQSDAIDRYRFLATLSEIRGETDAAGTDAAALADVRQRARKFLDDHETGPFFKSHHGDLFLVLQTLVKRAADAIGESPDPTLIADAESLWKRAKPLADRSTASDDEHYAKVFAEGRKAFENESRRTRVVTSLQNLLKTPTAATRAEAKSLVAATGLASDPDVAKLLGALAAAHKDSILFLPAKTNGPRATATDAFPLIPLVTVVKSIGIGRGTEPVVILSPTGVLSALNPRNGEPLWSKRLGIDSGLPPMLVHVAGPRVLAISNDQKSAFLLDRATGQPVWTHPLSAPAVAPPTIATGRLLIPLANGRIDVVDLTSGTFAGSFVLDQPVAAAGTPHPGSSLVTFIGTAHCLYVLDLAKTTCAAVIDTGHAAGATNGPAIFVAEKTRGWHVVTLAEPGPRVRLRAIPFPAEPPPKNAESDVVVTGSLSAVPYRDADTILLPADDGVLRQFGIRQAGNSDPLVFPMTPAEIALDRRTGHETARIVHVDADNIWIVSAGRLQRLHRSISPQQGPQLKPRWAASIPVGEVIGSADAASDATGTTLFLTTHVTGEAGARTTAIDGETGKMLWQSQLGSLPRDEPLVVGESVMWEDDAGVHFGKRMDPAGSGGFVPLPEPAMSRSLLVPSGAVCLRIGWTPHAARLTINEVNPETRTIGPTHEVKLPSPPAAAPILIDGGILVALASGVVVKVDLETFAAVTGPDWRRANIEAREPQLVRTGPKRFVATDGAGGLVTYEWAKSWKEIARVQDVDGAPVLQVKAILAAEPKVFATTPDGTLHQLDVDRLQPLPKRSWELKGKLTAGPWLVGAQLLCVVNRTRLVSLEPESWAVDFPVTLATRPLRIGDRFVLADVAGDFWTVNAADGSNQTPALSVIANLAPATTPVPLGEGRLFVIWSDGTAGVVAAP
jgi:outer membrane protein assembly factor BamB